MALDPPAETGDDLPYRKLDRSTLQTLRQLAASGRLTAENAPLLDALAVSYKRLVERFRDAANGRCTLDDIRQEFLSPEDAAALREARTDTELRQSSPSLEAGHPQTDKPKPR